MWRVQGSLLGPCHPRRCGRRGVKEALHERAQRGVPSANGGAEPGGRGMARATGSTRSIQVWCVWEGCVEVWCVCGGVCVEGVKGYKLGFFCWILLG